MTGNIGRPGTGANSITGQTNAMGSRLFSNTTGLLGGRDFLNPEHRKNVADILDIDENLIPQENSLPYHKILEEIKKGKIKGLWVIATNPGHSWIQRNEFKDIMGQLDYLVVQDLYHTTETADYANLVLPAAGWSEKEGVVINSERRLGLYKKTNKAPNHALSDFYIFKLIAEYWGCGDLFKAWTNPEATFQILKKLSKNMPCDFSGIKDYQMINEVEGIQWPFPENSKLESNQRRLFEDGKYYHADQKAKFIFAEVLEPDSTLSESHPFILLSGRGSSSQWHTGTRTSKSAILRKLYPKDIYVEICPSDAQDLKINDGELVKLKNERACIEARANITPTIKKGQLFLPMHYKSTNLLTHGSFDPDSSQPSYKYSAVNIEKTNF
jgi:assimilatory nitrate reductase catalytic subunit